MPKTIIVDPPIRPTAMQLRRFERQVQQTLRRTDVDGESRAALRHAIKVARERYKRFHRTQETPPQT